MQCKAPSPGSGKRGAPVEAQGACAITAEPESAPSNTWQGSGLAEGASEPATGSGDKKRQMARRAASYPTAAGVELDEVAGLAKGPNGLFQGLESARSAAPLGLSAETGAGSGRRQALR
eukprot:14964667-Alexandrium_andersonii.AAC.1